MWRLTTTTTVGLASAFVNRAKLDSESKAGRRTVKAVMFGFLALLAFN